MCGSTSACSSMSALAEILHHTSFVVTTLVLSTLICNSHFCSLYQLVSLNLAVLVRIWQSIQYGLSIKFLILRPPIFNPPSYLSSAFRVIISNTMSNKYGERTHPCLTSFLTRNHSNAVPVAWSGSSNRTLCI